MKFVVVRIKSAVEVIVFTVLRDRGTALARWIATQVGRKLFELPVVKTAYIGFGVTIASLLWVKFSGERWSDYGLKLMNGI